MAELYSYRRGSPVAEASRAAEAAELPMIPQGLRKPKVAGGLRALLKSKQQIAAEIKAEEARAEEGRRGERQKLNAK
jgi:hypothetical protein